jgi:hypothetical protein
MSNDDWERGIMQKWRDFLKEYKEPIYSMFPASIIHMNGFLQSTYEVEKLEQKEENK